MRRQLPDWPFLADPRYRSAVVSPWVTRLAHSFEVRLDQARQYPWDQSHLWAVCQHNSKWNIRRAQVLCSCIQKASDSNNHLPYFECHIESTRNANPIKYQYSIVYQGQKYCSQGIFAHQSWFDWTFLQSLIFLPRALLKCLNLFLYTRRKVYLHFQSTYVWVLREVLLPKLIRQKITHLVHSFKHSLQADRECTRVSAKIYEPMSN